MIIDINTIGYRWKGIYSPYLAYINGDVVYQNGGVQVYRNGTFTNFALGQQDATLAGQLVTGGGVSVGGSWGQVLHSNAGAGVEFRFEAERGGTVATSLLDTSQGSSCYSNNGYMMALMNEGMVRGWGTNSEGQLGIGGLGANWNQPKRAAFPSSAGKVVSMKSGYQVTFFIMDDGSLWSCGTNSESSTGTGAQRQVPTKMNGYGDLGATTKVIKVFTGYDYYGYQMCGCIDSNGYVYMWGTNNQGACGWGNTSAAVNPKIVPWSIQNPCRNVFVSGGNYQGAVFVTLDGRGFSCGQNDSSGLSEGDVYYPTSFKPMGNESPIKKYAASESDAHWIAGAQYYRKYGVLLENGNLYMWGHDNGQVTGGWGDGTTGDNWATGSGMKLCLTGVQDFFAKAGGYNNSVAMMKDGTVKATGSSQYYANLSPSATTTWATVGGSNLTNCTKLLSAGGTYGSTHTVLRSDGKVVSWGNGASGIRGSGNIADTLTPEFALLNKTVIDIQYSFGSQAAITSGLTMLCSDGSVYYTGRGDGGISGSGTNNGDRYTPNQIIF